MIGRLLGIERCEPNGIRTILERIRQIRTAFVEASALAESKARVSPLKIERLVATLGDDQRIEREVGQISDAYHAFLGNDHGCLCYLIADRGRRYRLAQYALRLRGLPDS